MRNTKHSGFTLIELLVVIAIIGLLSSVVFASLIGARQRGRDANRVTTMNQIANVLAIEDTGVAVNFAGCTGKYALLSACTTPAGFTSGAGLPIEAIFKDPTGTLACIGEVPGEGPTTSVAPCQYSISDHLGNAGATTQDYQICSYLEKGVGSLSAGLISLNSHEGAGMIVGCK